MLRQTHEPHDGAGSGGVGGAQLTLARNRIALPDIVKRPYLMRGLMKCSHCGLTYIGTVSQDKMADKLSEADIGRVEIRDSFSLKRYYMCNGKNLGHCVHGPDALNCPSGHIRARELEALVWSEIDSFLNSPKSVIDELLELLRERLGEGGGVGGSELFKEFDVLCADAAGKEAERNALYRLFRKGMLPETDFESQLAELREEETAITRSLEKVDKRWRKRRSPGARLMVRGRC